MSPSLSVVVLECADLAASRRFYETLLALRFVEERHGSGPLHYSADLDGVVLELYAGQPGQSTVGFAVRNRPAAQRRLGAQGPIHDPDGRRILLTEAERFDYIGPAHVLEHTAGFPPGARIDTVDALAAWLAHTSERAATYTVGLEGWLTLAPLHSEHVACANRQPVLAAGVVTFVSVAGAWEVDEITNQSTGYCPPPECWEAVEAALDGLSVAHPGDWTYAFDFRRCDACGNIHTIKDGVFLCACGAALDIDWNF